MNRHYSIRKQVKEKGVETAIVITDIVEAAAEVIPVPGLKTAATILGQILKLVDQRQKNTGTCGEIVDRCERAYNAISQHMKSVNSTPEISEHIKRFVADLKEVQRFVEKNQRRHHISQFVFSKAINDELQRLEKRVDSTVQLFQIKMALSGQESSTVRLQRIEHGIEYLKNAISPASSSEDTSIQTVPSSYIVSGKEIANGPHCRYYAAKMQTKRVVVKVFEGGDATSNWKLSNELSMNVMHPHLPRLIGTSDAHARSPFSVYDLHIKGSVESVLMSSINLDLKEAYYRGVELVHGISSALDYLLWQEAVPLVDLDAEMPKWVINAFWDTRIGPILTIDPAVGPAIPYRDPVPVTTPTPTRVHISKGKISHRESEDLVSRSLSVMNNILIKIFVDVNKILYADDVDRSHEPRQVDTEETAYVPGHAPDSGPSNTGNSVPLGTSSVRQSDLTAIKPRRELVWKVAGGDEANLKETSRRYKLLLDGRSQSRRPIRRVWAPSTQPTYHRCAEYRREEVTFTHSAFDNRVLVSMTPSLNEICLNCGEQMMLPETGCYTCRILGKKCDEDRDHNGRCKTCVLFAVRCLEFSPKRPEWSTKDQDIVLQTLLHNVAGGSDVQQDFILSCPTIFVSLKACWASPKIEFRRPAISCILELARRSSKGRKEMVEAGILSSLRHTCEVAMSHASTLSEEEKDLIEHARLALNWLEYGP